MNLTDPADPDATRLTAWGPMVVDIWRLTEALTGQGWKVDTEESDLMSALSKTWREAGVKVWLVLSKFVSAPPHDQRAGIEALCFYRFDPSALPVRSLYEQTYDPGDEDEPWFASHFAENRWLIEHGDPNFCDEHLMSAIPLGAVPVALRQEVEVAITAAMFPAPPLNPRGWG